MPSKKLRVSVTITEEYLEAVQGLVGRGVYLNQGEAIRAGFRLLFMEHKLDIMCKRLGADVGE